MAQDEQQGVKVSMATENDIPELIPIFLDAFSGPAKKSTFPETDGGRKWLERSFNNFLGSKSQYHPESKVAVVRNANGTHTCTPDMSSYHIPFPRLFPYRRLYCDSLALAALGQSD